MYGDFFDIRKALKGHGECCVEKFDETPKNDGCNICWFLVLKRIFDPGRNTGLCSCAINILFIVREMYGTLVSSSC